VGDNPPDATGADNQNIGHGFILWV